MHITTNEGSKARKKVAQALRNKDPSQESDEGNSQDNDEDKFQDFSTDRQVGAGAQRASEKNKSDRFPNVCEYFATSLDMFVGRSSDVM